jgi:phospholipid transport system substrate-binding protein
MIHPSTLVPNPIRALAATTMRLALALLLVASPGLARANGTPAENAETTVKKLIEQVSTDLDKLHKEKKIGDRAAIEQLIRTDILPNIDQQRLTQRVFRHLWPQIVSANKQADAQERVTSSLVRTYAVALSSYNGDTLNVVKVNEEGNKGTAKTRVRRPNGQTIQVDFSLGSKDGKWLINDMSVDGIVVSYTLFNAIKPVFEKDGLEAALNAVSQVDVNKEQPTKAQDSDKQ